MSLRIERPLGALSREDAKARLEALGEYFQNKHGLAVTWQGDSAAVRGKYLVVTIDGTLRFEGDKVVFEGQDPGMLWRGKAKEYLAAKLEKYLEPSRPLADLPRR
ncbi:MAG TPA: polyhydroxyalkanoic acid system family protein [Polyangiaceae bacterium]|nr:polyhydroxyalkanoic acid system family protein [Polyangiaceae bacterium]